MVEERSRFLLLPAEHRTATPAPSCGIVDKPSGVARTVYVNGSSVAAFFTANALKDVGILKIDAGAGSARWAGACVSLGDAESSLGDTKSSLGGAKSSLGDTKSSLGDAESSLGDAESSLGDAESSLGDAESSLGDAKTTPWG